MFDSFYSSEGSSRIVSSEHISLRERKKARTDGPNIDRRNLWERVRSFDITMIYDDERRRGLERDLHSTLASNSQEVREEVIC